MEPKSHHFVHYSSSHIRTWARWIQSKLCHPAYFKIHFNIIPPYTPRPFKWCPVLRFPHPSPLPFSLIRAKCLELLILFNLPVLIIFSKECRFWGFCSCSLFLSPVTSFLLGPNIFFSTLFSNTLSLCPSLSVRDQVWYQYKITGKIVLALCYQNKNKRKKVQRKMMHKFYIKIFRASLEVYFFFFRYLYKGEWKSRTCYGARSFLNLLAWSSGHAGALTRSQDLLLTTVQRRFLPQEFVCNSV